MGWMEKRKSKTRAQQRAAGTKKTALFDIVNRNIAATARSRRARAPPRRHDNPLVSRPSARLGAGFVHGVDTRARAGTQGPRDESLAIEVDVALRTYCAGSRVSFRFAPLARDTRVRRDARPVHFFFRARASFFGGGLYTMPSSFMPSGSVK